MDYFYLYSQLQKETTILKSKVQKTAESLNKEIDKEPSSHHWGFYVLLREGLLDTTPKVHAWELNKGGCSEHIVFSLSPDSIELVSVGDYQSTWRDAAQFLNELFSRSVPSENGGAL